jgi:hypothetical protein
LVHFRGAVEVALLAQPVADLHQLGCFFVLIHDRLVVAYRLFGDRFLATAAGRYKQYGGATENRPKARGVVADGFGFFNLVTHAHVVFFLADEAK